MLDSPLIVVKVGGSVLTLPDLSARLEKLLHDSPALRPVFIAGGGALADVVRAWDAALALGEQFCHELALETMSTTASLLAHRLPRGRVVDSFAAAEACWSRGERPVLNVKSWLAQNPASTDDLPASWEVTSDSLAAWVALQWHADELWLLKSVDLPESMTIAEASAAGFVDRHFPRLAGRLPSLRWHNLRAAP